MAAVCWIDNFGKVKNSLSPGEVYMINAKTHLTFRIPSESLIAKSANLNIVSENPEKIPFKTTYKGYHSASCIPISGGKLKYFIDYIDDVSVTPQTTEVHEILVQPVIEIQGSEIDYQEICLQTNLSRCLGPLQNWKNSLLSQISLGFNLFHITAVQSLGKYGSLYCIGDYLALNSEFFPNNDKNINEEEKITLMRNLVKDIDRYGAGMIVDIVLSHCSSVNPIFSMNSNAAYTLTNTPHLNVAYELDKALQEFTTEMHDRRLKFQCGNRIESLNDLSYIMSIVRDKLKNLRLKEYFLMDTNKVLTCFTSAETSVCNITEEKLAYYKSLTKTLGIKGLLKKHFVENLGYSRFGVKLRNEEIWTLCKSLGMTREVILREVLKEVQSLNTYFETKFSRFFQTILQNIEAEIKYQKLELRVFEVTPNKPLVKPYFTSLPNGEIALLNGFIINNKNVKRDISEKWEYLKRNVICWRDCVKLRYKKNREECVELWDTIEKYVVGMAKIFKGFRLDNCHGTSLEATKYFIEKSREVNPNLLVIAELFTGSAQLDTEYVQEIGINFLIRESLNHKSPNSFSDFLYNSAQKNTGIIRKIPEILYDFTHDNPTLTQCRTTEDYLSNMILTAMFRGPTASTRGYEEVIPNQLSVVEEKRLYKTYNEELMNINHVPVLEVRDNAIRVCVEYYGNYENVEIRGDWDGWKRSVRLLKSGDRFIVNLLFPKVLRGMEYGFKFILNNNEWLCDKRYRHYQTWDGYWNNLLRVEENIPSLSADSNDLREFRRAVNIMRRVLHREQYTDLSNYCYDNNILKVTLKNPNTQHCYTLLTRISYSKESGVSFSLKFDGTIDSHPLAGTIAYTSSFIDNNKEIHGIPIQVRSQNAQTFFSIQKSQDTDTINLYNAIPGFILLLKILPQKQNQVIQVLRKLEVLDSFTTCQHFFEGLGLIDINLVVWRTAEEEKNFGKRNLYKFPGLDNTKYAGIAGLVTYVEDYNNLQMNHPIYINLLQGNWYIDFQVSRIKDIDSKVFYFYVNDTLNLIKELSRPQIAEFSVKFFCKLFKALKNYTVKHLMKCEIFSNTLVYYATQMFSSYDLAHLCRLERNLGKEDLCFENFWSVDLLISMNLFGKCEEVLVGFAFSMKITKNKKVNYANCIGFLNAVRVYLEGVYPKATVLNIQIGLVSFRDIVYDIFDHIAKNILDIESGLILIPPNQTWMSSESRQGAPIEITAYLFTILDFFSELDDFPQAIYLPTGTLTLKEWQNLIKNSFEDLYWIPTSRNSIYMRPELAKTRGIYKDTIGSLKEQEEYQCRPNVYIAMVIAPDLFNADLARKCLKNTKKLLVNDSEFAIKTLSLDDLEYSTTEEFKGDEHIWLYAWYLEAALMFEEEKREKVWEFLGFLKNNMKIKWFCIPEKPNLSRPSGLGYLSAFQGFKLTIRLVI
ncbi:hypothetical protein SteCoe_9979 [Stentor coeruleus]|uniref:Glycogen debranching enzyme n=1 Tax=Stentor coeruleus TaxID=5963 RepID=A0A1R2CGU4_9CILI|nr:hypothetical protein SteCoe_9979 [Stentor coeruleus]